MKVIKRSFPTLLLVIISFNIFAQDSASGSNQRKERIGIVFTALPKFGQYPKRNYTTAAVAGGLLGVAVVSALDGSIDDRKDNRSLKEHFLVSNMVHKMKESLASEFGMRGKDVLIINEDIDLKSFERSKYTSFNRNVITYCKEHNITDLFIVEVKKYGVWGIEDDVKSYLNLECTIVNGIKNNLVWRISFDNGEFIYDIQGDWKNRPDPEKYLESFYKNYKLAERIVLLNLENDPRVKLPKIISN